MSEPNEPIWNYLDQADSPEERAELERRLAEDADFRKAFLERKELDAQLKKTEAEEPSMRFVQNIMDRLPELYRRTFEPLVRPLWIRIFAGTISLFFLGVLALGYYGVQTGQLKAGGTTATLSEKFVGAFAGLPSQVLSLIAALSIGYLGLLLLDRLLKKRLLKRT